MIQTRFNTIMIYHLSKFNILAYTSIYNRVFKSQLCFILADKGYKQQIGEKANKQISSRGSIPEHLGFFSFCQKVIIKMISRN